uniref:IclR family transcriptional regulator n=1 Tax=uncultured bacterium pAG2 TaxID=1781152 RepID=A0A1C9U4I5_9BACT|nr:IclR family transcriptional regulator [uncultured bacterium pAG2]
MGRKLYMDTDQTLVKALDLLELLSEDNIIATAPVLTRKLKISSNKLFHILETLEIKGFVERDEEAGIYRLGLCAIGMAQHILKSASILRLAHPTLENLARKHDEAAYITVLDNDEVVFIDMVDSLQQVKAVPFIGRRFPIFSNAAGKVIKAMSSADVLARHGKTSAGKAGINNIKQLESELNDIRLHGVAVDNNCLAEGVCSVAVAIKDYAGMVVGALTLLAPTFRMLQERLEKEIIPSMLEMSEELSMKFGYAKIQV